MLKRINDEAYQHRPETLADRTPDSGLWFFPGEDAHALMKEVRNVTGRLVRDAATQLDAVTLYVGPPEPEEPTTEILIGYTFRLPEGRISGEILIQIVAYTTEFGEYTPFLKMYEDVATSVADINEALETTAPAAIALTY